MTPARSDNRQLIRCAWATGELMIRYHDEEWGVPAHDDRLLFEFLILEGAQAGLSWNTILNKRENYRRAFSGFHAQRVARYDRRKVAELLRDPGIVRNRLKIASAIANARAFLLVQKEFGTFDRYIWQFVDGKPTEESSQITPASPRAHAAIRRYEQRPQAPRLQLRRIHNLLRLHASGRDGQRSRRRLLPLCALCADQEILRGNHAATPRFSCAFQFALTFCPRSTIFCKHRDNLKAADSRAPALRVFYLCRHV